MDSKSVLMDLDGAQVQTTRGNDARPLRLILEEMRIRDWVKNLLLFAPIVFSQRLLDPYSLAKSAEAFLSFGLIASSGYVLNDLFDFYKDQFHPEKRRRPIASRALSINTGRLLALLLFILGWATAAAVNLEFMLIMAFYSVLSACYSVYLKHQVILDVLILASFYVIRIFAGGAAIGVYISNWLLICTFLLALFLGFGKRRYELSALKGDAELHRDILSEYTPYLLDQLIGVVTPASLVVYSLYTMDQDTVERFHSRWLPLTIPFVLYGIFRYLYLVHRKGGGGEPQRLVITDKPLVLAVVGWFLTIFSILYLRGLS